jgi:hypothetical protein
MALIALPCPFCGYVQDVADESSYETDQGTKWGRFCCGACGAKGPEVRTSYFPWNRRYKILAPCNRPRKMTTWGQEAVKEWNQRTDKGEQQ